MDFEETSATSNGASAMARTASVKGDNARLISHATNTAVVAARSILMNGGTEETALKTAKAAAQSVLIPQVSETESVSARSTSFLRRRKAKRQAEIVASMALVSATSDMQSGNISRPVSNLDWDSNSVRSGVSHLSTAHQLMRNASNNVQQGQYTNNPNGHQLNPQQQQQPYNYQQQHYVQPQFQPSPTYRDEPEQSVISGMSRGYSPASSSLRITVPPIDGQQNQNQQVHSPMSATATKPPKSPVKEILSRKRPEKEQAQVDTAAERLVNGEDSIDRFPRTVARLDSIRNDPQDRAEDPIYCNDDESTCNGRDDSYNDETSLEETVDDDDDDDTRGLGVSFTETRTYEDDTDCDESERRGQDRIRVNRAVENSFDSVDSGFAKSDPFLTSFTDAFSLFKCTPFNYSEPTETEVRTNHRGQRVSQPDSEGRDADETDEGTVDTTRRERNNHVNGYTDDDASTFRRVGMSDTSGGNHSATNNLHLSNSSEGDIKVKNSFLETLERVVLESSSRVLDEKETTTPTAEVKPRRQMSVQAPMRDFSVPGELPVVSPRNDPDTTIIKKKKGWGIRKKIFKGKKSEDATMAVR